MVEKPAPGDDFYRACNEIWLRQTALPPYRASYGVSEELEESLEGLLYTIAQKATRLAAVGTEPKTPGGLVEDAVGRLVLSAMRPEKQPANVAHLTQSLRGLGCLRGPEDIATTLGTMIRFGIPTVLDITVDTIYDQGERRNMLLLQPGSLGLPDARYYLQRAGTFQSAEVLRDYRELLAFLSRELDPGFTLEDGIATEMTLAEPLEKFVEETEVRIIPFAEVRRQFRAIPWDQLFAALGIPVPRGRIGIIAEGWLSVVNSMVEGLPVEQWRLLFGIHTAVHGIAYLPAPYDQRHFEVFGRRLQGETKKAPQHILTMNLLTGLMGDYMSFLFTEQYLSAKEKAAARAFVESLVGATKKRLLETPWMVAATRRACADKVAAMRTAVMYPDRVRPPTPVPALQTDLLLANVYLLAAAQLERQFARLEHPVGAEWDEPVFTVNAYYYQETNEIVLPAGNFLWPFYSSRRLGWSYGGLGAIIAHEIIHAFDEEGRLIDAKGGRKAMWSASDERQYTTRLEQLIRLFNQAKVGGTYVNGLLTASENLADLGGVAIALEALEGRLRGVAAAKRVHELREFFWAYAVSWRTKVRPTKALQNISLDKHAPPTYRVNYVVSQFDQWYEVFGVKTGDDLYIPPEERIRIF